MNLAEAFERRAQRGPHLDSSEVIGSLAFLPARTGPAEGVPAVPGVEFVVRTHRGRGRRLIAMAAVVAIVGVIAASWLLARDPRRDVRLNTGTTSTTTTPQALAPSLEGLETPPTGHVSVLARGTMGGAQWWLLTYAAALPDPRTDGEYVCTIITNASGVPFPGGGGCRGGNKGGEMAGSGFGDAHIGTQDILFAEASRDVDEIRAVTVDGESLQATLYPIPRSHRVVWMLPLPSHGSVAGYSDRARTLLRRAYLVRDGRERTFYPDEQLLLVPRDGPDAEHEAFCRAAEAYGSSGASNEGGVLSAEAVPFLEAIVKAAPADILGATLQVLASAKAGQPVGAPGRTVLEYWSEHC